MAKSKFINNFELDVIRVGVATGHNAPAIARFLGRNKLTIYNHISSMAEAGTLQDLPFNFVADEIGSKINGGK